MSSGFSFSRRSLNSLNGVHPDLVRVVHLALSLTPVDFVVIEGLRDIKRQRELMKIGATRTLNSRHLTGHAIDIAAWENGTVSWHWPLYKKMSVAFKSAAEQLSVPIVWGGDWRSFRDGPHYELNRKFYPAVTKTEK